MGFYAYTNAAEEHSTPIFKFHSSVISFVLLILPFSPTNGLRSYTYENFFRDLKSISRSLYLLHAITDHSVYTECNLMACVDKSGTKLYFNISVCEDFQYEISKRNLSVRNRVIVHVTLTREYFNVTYVLFCNVLTSSVSLSDTMHRQSVYGHFCLSAHKPANSHLYSSYSESEVKYDVFGRVNMCYIKDYEKCTATSHKI